MFIFIPLYFDAPEMAVPSTVHSITVQYSKWVKVPILLFKFKLEMVTSLQYTVIVVVHGTRLSDLEETDQWVFRPKIGLDLKIGQAGL